MSARPNDVNIGQLVRMIENQRAHINTLTRELRGSLLTTYVLCTKYAGGVATVTKGEMLGAAGCGLLAQCIDPTEGAEVWTFTPMSKTETEAADATKAGEVDPTGAIETAYAPLFDVNGKPLGRVTEVAVLEGADAPDVSDLM